MKLADRVLKALTGPKDQFQIAKECGNHIRVQDVFTALINLESQGWVFQVNGKWCHSCGIVWHSEPRRLAANSIFNMAEAA
jgi:predicted Rossmann fold nucleotide-binding protein DprA/Smf involved in DNA uptake